MMQNQALASHTLTSLSCMQSAFLSPIEPKQLFSRRGSDSQTKFPSELLGMSNGRLATEIRHWMLLLMLWASILISMT